VKVSPVQLNFTVAEYAISSMVIRVRVLNAFVVTPTRFSEPGWWTGNLTKAQFESRHVFFQADDKETYISKLFQAIE